MDYGEEKDESEENMVWFVTGRSGSTSSGASTRLDRVQTVD
jgi:hypothetical protein